MESRSQQADLDVHDKTISLGPVKPWNFLESGRASSQVGDKTLNIEGNICDILVIIVVISCS